MEDRPWRGWLACLLVGAALAVLVLGWLGRGQAPAVEGADRDGVGFELVLRFQVLLPDRAEDQPENR